MPTVSFNRRLGRNHPLIKPQYCLEEIDATGVLFTPLCRVLTRSDHERRPAPVPGRRYALLVDGAGEDEAEGDAASRLLLANRKRRVENELGSAALAAILD